MDRDTALIFGFIRSFSCWSFCREFGLNSRNCPETLFIALCVFKKSVGCVIFFSIEKTKVV